MIKCSWTKYLITPPKKIGNSRAINPQLLTFMPIGVVRVKWLHLFKEIIEKELGVAQG
jgi:hypothetical protein